MSHARGREAILKRYRAEYRAACVEAQAAETALRHTLTNSASLRQVAKAAKRAQRAAASLYTAAACLLSPP